MAKQRQRWASRGMRLQTQPRGEQGPVSRAVGAAESTTRSQRVPRGAIAGILVGLCVHFWMVLAVYAFVPAARAEDASTEPIAKQATVEPEIEADTQSGRPSASRVPDVFNVPRSAAGASLPGDAGRAGSAAPGLDALLKLPDAYRAQPAPAVAGTTEAQWRKRFQQAVGSVTDARASLVATKEALDGAATSGGSSQWAVAPPGGAGGESGAPNSASTPVSFKLRQQLKANRLELDEAEKAFRELSIQADLAGVPEAWRGSMPDGGSSRELGQLLD